MNFTLKMCWFLFIGIITIKQTRASIKNSSTSSGSMASIANKQINTNNLTSILWAHAVNSQKELDDALRGNIDFIEADIVLGTLTTDPTHLVQPIMGHPPRNDSDISLNSFLDQILKYNTENSNSSKGVKLDFKSIEVFEGSLALLTSLWSKMNYPVWINADILPGPLNNTVTVPVDANRFFAGAKQLPASVLSIGWTTLWGNNFTEGNYTDKQVRQMIDTIQLNKIPNSGHDITFPVRAGIAALSSDSLHELVAAVNQTNNVTLTIWSSNDDHVDVDSLRKLIFSFGLDKVYVDVPEELSNQLNLSNAPGTAPSIVTVGIITILMLLTSLLFTNNQI